MREDEIGHNGRGYGYLSRVQSDVTELKRTEFDTVYFLTN